MVRRRSGPRWWKVPEDVRRQMIRLAARGGTYESIAEEVGAGVMTVWGVLKPLGGVIRPEYWQPPSGARLTLDQRIEIALGLREGKSLRAIGSAIGRHASTVCREVNANGGAKAYRPTAAHYRARELARRPKPTKLSHSPALCERVTGDLLKMWSPQQIARRLCSEFGDDESMRVSHETIYKSLYVQGRGELRRELARCLRTGRAKRVPRGRLEKRGKIPGMVMISERPAEVADRAIPGHWEGDLIMGKGHKSAVGTLVERSTRYVMLLHLPNGRGAEQVRQAMAQSIQTLPEALRRSITWDQGSEMAQHARLLSTPACRSTSATPTAPGSAAATKTPTDCYANTYPKAQTYLSTTKTLSTR